MNTKKILLLTAFLAAFTFTSCDDDDKNRIAGNDELYQSILMEYVDKTIVPTYKSLAEAALEMRFANSALKAYASDTHMQLASAAWMKARILWEKNEAFLFGPVGEEA